MGRRARVNTHERRGPKSAGPRQLRLLGQLRQLLLQLLHRGQTRSRCQRETPARIKLGTSHSLFWEFPKVHDEIYYYHTLLLPEEGASADKLQEKAATKGSYPLLDSQFWPWRTGICPDHPNIKTLYRARTLFGYANTLSTL